MINTETKTQLISHDVGGSLRHLHRILISLPGASLSTQPMSKSESERSEAAFPKTAELRLICWSARDSFWKNFLCS